MGSSKSAKNKKKRRAGLALAAIALAMATTQVGNAQRCWQGNECQGQTGCQEMWQTAFCDTNCSPTNCQCFCRETYYICVSAYCADYECLCSA